MMLSIDELPVNVVAVVFQLLDEQVECLPKSLADQILDVLIKSESWLLFTDKPKPLDNQR